MSINNFFKKLFNFGKENNLTVSVERDVTPQRLEELAKEGNVNAQGKLGYNTIWHSAMTMDWAWKRVSPKRQNGIKRRQTKVILMRYE